MYEDAFCVELGLQAISFERQVPIHLGYKGRAVGEARVDLIVEKRLVVELKAVDGLAPIHTAQMLSYLKATGIHVGLLINFHAALLHRGIKRVIRNPNTL